MNMKEKDLHQDKPDSIHVSKNKLNDLTGKEWLQLSRSYWFQTGLGKDSPDTNIETQHPAPFSFLDIKKLIRQFTKAGMTVLDPFCGVGSTLKAAALTGRNAIGIEISSRWCRLAKQRLEIELPLEVRSNVLLRIVRGDCLKRLPKMKPDSIDFIVTSPPYWNILTKAPDLKMQKERVSKGLKTKYSDSPDDLGNIPDYNKYLDKLSDVFTLSKELLRKDGYFAIIVGDFRNGSKFYPLHMDVTRIALDSGLSLKGTLILIQSNKKLYPYGYPSEFVQNIHHQYCLIFRKDRD